MTEEKEQESWGNRIYSNIPTITGIIFLFLALAIFFSATAIPIASNAVNWIGLTLPFAVVVASIFLVINHVRPIIRRSPTMYLNIILLACFVVSFLVPFVVPGGLANPSYVVWYSLFGQGATAGVFTMAGIVIVMGYLRVYIARSNLRRLMIVVGLFGVAYGTGIIQTLLPWLSPLAIWEQDYIIGQAEFAFWMAYYIGGIALIVRILLFIEKLRPR